DPNTIQKVKLQAAELLRDLPENASRGIDAIVKTASETAKSAVEQGRETVRQWTDGSESEIANCLNASASLLGWQNVDQTSGSLSSFELPLDPEVISVGLAMLSKGKDRAKTEQSLSTSLNQLTSIKGDRLLVASSLDSAISASVAALANGEVLIHRSQAIRLPSGTPLPDLFIGQTVRECGGSDAFHESDFGVRTDPCVVLADDGVRPISPLVRSAGFTIAVLPIAMLGKHEDSIPSAEQLRQEGIDLVVFAGGTLIGGPASGLILGSSDLIERIESNPRWASWSANDLTRALTLAAFHQAVSPFRKLVETNIENLRSRAERMATRLTGCSAITQCQVTDEEATLLKNARWKFPSRQLKLRHERLSARDWNARLHASDPSIITTVQEDDLVVDLRWISPSDDSSLSERLEGETSST
ncbi:MAG: hypothetical protein AAF802_17390, partial [Planctomycetota bacterium]